MYIVISWTIFIACAFACIWREILFGVYKSYSFWNNIPIKLYVLSFLSKITVVFLFLLSIFSSIVAHEYTFNFVVFGILSIFIFDLVCLAICPRRPVNAFLRSVDGVRFAVPAPFFWQNAEAYRIHRDGDVFGALIRSDLLALSDERALFDPLVTVHSNRSENKWKYGKYCIENSIIMTQLDQDGTYQVFEGNDKYSTKNTKHNLRKYYLTFDSKGDLVKSISIFGNKTNCEMIAFNCYVEIYYDYYVPIQEIDFENEKALKMVASWRVKRTISSEIKYYINKILSI